jgi:isocitrate dehydrogenase
MSTAIKLEDPAQGSRITISNGKLVVPDQPIVPFIEGDGTGPDIWRASVRVLDAAVAKAYGGRRKLHWMEVYAGQKSNDLFQHLAARRDRRGLPGIPGVDQGPLTTPIGGGTARSTSPCGKCSTSTCVCDRCAGSRVCPRP